MYFLCFFVVWIVIDNNVLIVLLCLLNKCVIRLLLWFRFRVNCVKLLDLIEKLLKMFRNLLVSKVFDGSLYIMIMWRLFLFFLSFCFLRSLIIWWFFFNVWINGIMILILVKFILLWMCFMVLYLRVK